MKKVTTINLSGRAYQLEEPAYSAVHEYLEKAKRALAHDPDQAEILADLELSIADKWSAILTDSKTVVTQQDMDTILEALGPVETESEEDVSSSAKAANKPRRLYLIKDGAMLAGVCKGLAAYLNMDVRIVRVLMVILAFITNGLLVIVYLLLALLLPTADDTEKLAAAYGYDTTAQEVMERARQRVTDGQALDRVGGVLTKIWRICCRFAAVVAMAGATAATIGYGVGLLAIALDRTELVGSLAHYNGWPQWLGLTALYLAVLAPLLILYRLFDRWANLRGSTRATLTTDVSLLAVWVVAAASAISLVTFASADFRNYANKHNGYIDFKQSSICVDNSRCGTMYTDSEGKQCRIYEIDTITGNCVKL